MRIFPVIPPWKPRSGIVLDLISGTLLAVLPWATLASGQSYEWTTVAGSTGGVGFRDGPAGTAMFKRPLAIATDAAGNVYLSDTGNHTIRRIAPDGMISTVAGKGGVPGQLDGPGDQARFNQPGGIALADDGSLLIADTGNHTIRKISPGGMVTTVAGEAGVSGHGDGSGTTARFSSPTALTLAPGGLLFVADTANHLIRRITPAGAVSTFAGQAGTPGAADGAPGVAHFNSPKGLAAAADGTLYVADTDNCLIRTIAPDGRVGTLAGQALAFDHVDGIGTEASFYDPEGIVVDSARNVYVTDPSYGTIRKISASDAMVTTVAGDITAANPGRIDGIGTATLFNEPHGMAIATDGSLLVADTGNHALRRVTTGGVVTTFVVNPPRRSGAVDATGTNARFRIPFGLTVDGNGVLFIADTGNYTIRQISPAGDVTTFVGTAGLSGSADATGAAARFMSPRAVAIGPGGVAYVADFGSNNDGKVRKVTPARAVTTLAGNPGTLPPAEAFYYLTGLTVDPSGNVFVSDFTSLRKITPAGVSSLFAGQNRIVTEVPGGGTMIGWRYSGPADGTGNSAYFNHPSAVAIDADRNLFVTEYGGCIIRKVTPTGQATTVAGTLDNTRAIPGFADGTGAAARFRNPRGIAVDAHGTVYITDSGNHVIRKLSPAGVVTTIGGLPGYAGCGEGTGDRALFNQPYGITVDASGTLYVADTANDRIVKGVATLQPDLVVADSAGNHFAAGSPALDFGHVAPALTGPAQTLTVINAGNTPLSITGLELSGANSSDFIVDRTGLPGSIPANGSGVIRVTCHPAALGPLSALLRIFTNDPDTGSLAIGLRGMGNSLPVFGGYAVSVPPVSPVVISSTKLVASAFDADGDALTVTAVAWPNQSSTGLRLEGDSIRIVPSASSLTGSWKFLATLTDARGGTVTGTVTVTFQAPTADGAGSMASNPPRLTVLPDGTISVAFHGIPGRSYVLQRSANLTNWLSLATLTADSSGRILHIDAAPLLPNGYYRLASP
jgi:sugar lactone lactonase YvrE